MDGSIQASKDLSTSVGVVGLPQNAGAGPHWIDISRIARN